MQTSSIHSSTRGILMVLAAAVLWGTTGTAQSLAPPQLASVWIGALRLVVAALFFVIWLGLTEREALRPARLRALPWRDLAGCALCMVLYNLSFFAGVRELGVAVGTAVALGSGPVWAGLLQALLLRRPPALPWWGATLVAVGGAALMLAGAGHRGAWSASGLGLCLLAGLSYAVYATLNQRTVAVTSAAAVTGASFTLAALLALPAAAALAGPLQPGRSDLLIALWLGVMSTGVAYLLLSHALRHISSATAVVLALCEPVTAFVLAVAVVGEWPGWSALAGLAALLAGLGGVIRAERAGTAASPHAEPAQ